MLDPEGPLSYIVLVLLIFLGAFFTGTEAAFSFCNRYKIKVWADDGSIRAKITMKLIEKFDNAIITILAGTNIVQIATSVIATIIFVGLLGENGSIVSTIVVTLTIFMFGELIPKNIAKSNSDKWSLNASLIIWFFMIILYPLTFFFTTLISLLNKLVGSKHQVEQFTDDDFTEIVEKISEDGVIDEEESEIIIACVDFGETVVSDVYTKRENMFSLNINKCTNEYLREYLLESNITYSRIPVYKNNIDNIIGILHVKSYLKSLWNKENVDIKSLLLKPYFVDPKIKLDEILEGFKEHKTHIAIIQEKNKTIGMVTMKDVLEELVSDIDELGTSDSKEV